MADNEFTVVATKTFTDEDIRCLLISAFEGGSNYWYRIAEHDYGVLGEAAFHYGGQYADPEYAGGLHLYLIPFAPGCALLIEDVVDGGGKTYRLDREALQLGLDLLAESETYAHHWRDLVMDNADSVTADVFLQLCLFGDVIYG